MVYGNVLAGGEFDDFFEDLFSTPTKVFTPHKHSLLHEVIENLLNFYFDYATRKWPNEVDYFHEILNEAGLASPKWLTPSRVDRHIGELDDLLSQAASVLKDSVFYILFSDREFLRNFQHRLAPHVKSLSFAEYPESLQSDGVIKRPAYLPSWLKAAIFHRDRGRCQHCSKDLTGLGMPVRDLHLDHMIPLRQSGSNDPTNFQLLCARCNLSKGARKLSRSVRYTPYW